MILFRRGESTADPANTLLISVPPRRTGEVTRNRRSRKPFLAERPRGSRIGATQWRIVVPTSVWPCHGWRTSPPVATRGTMRGGLHRAGSCGRERVRCPARRDHRLGRGGDHHADPSQTRRRIDDHPRVDAKARGRLSSIGRPVDAAPCGSIRPSPHPRIQTAPPRLGGGPAIESAARVVELAIVVRIPPRDLPPGWWAGPASRSGQHGRAPEAGTSAKIVRVQPVAVENALPLRIRRHHQGRRETTCGALRRRMARSRRASRTSEMLPCCR